MHIAGREAHKGREWKCHLCDFGEKRRVFGMCGEHLADVVVRSRSGARDGLCDVV